MFSNPSDRNASSYFRRMTFRKMKKPKLSVRLDLRLDCSARPSAPAPPNWFFRQYSRRCSKGDFPVHVASFRRSTDCSAACAGGAPLHRAPSPHTACSAAPDQPHVWHRYIFRRITSHDCLVWKPTSNFTTLKHMAGLFEHGFMGVHT